MRPQLDSSSARSLTNGVWPQLGEGGVRESTRGQARVRGSVRPRALGGLTSLLCLRRRAGEDVRSRFPGPLLCRRSR